MIAREPFTEPYTLRERYAVWLDLNRYRRERFWSETLPIRVAQRLPRRVRLWVVVLAAADTGVRRDLAPDRICYPDMATDLDNPR